MVTHCLLVLAFTASSQSIFNEAGARAAALGNSSASFSDTWSLFNNPGGLGMLEETTAFGGVHNRFGISGLITIHAGITHHLPLGSVGFGAIRFGDDVYNEQALTLAYGNKLGITSLGLRVNYYQLYVEEFDSQNLITFDFGGITTLTEQVSLGAYIRNVSQSQLRQGSRQATPTVLYLGATYKPLEKLLLTAEVAKDIDLKPEVKAGLEYQFLKKFSARTGINTGGSQHHLGLGFNSGQLKIDATSSWHPVLGFSHQASVSYQLL